MRAQLLLYREGTFETVLDLTPGSYLVGREEGCDVVLDHPTVSRQHFRLEVDGDGSVSLEDLGAENGTYVGGVREFNRILEGRTTIQAGNAMMVYVPAGGGSEDETPESLVLPTKGHDGEQPLPVTSGVAPVALRKLQAEMRVRMRPHLELQTPDAPSRLFALGPALTPIGYGDVSVSLGPPERGGSTVVAEVVATRDDRFEARAKGLFARIRVNGKDCFKARLEPGDRLQIAEHTLVFGPGIHTN